MKSVFGKLKTSVGGCVSVVLLASVSMVGLAGCTPQQQATAKNAAALISQEIPKALPVIAVACSVTEAVDPAIAPAATAFCAATNTVLNQLAIATAAYAANPTATVWASIVQLVDGLVSQGSSALMQAAHIIDPASRDKATVAIGAAQTLILLIDSFIQRTQTPAQNAATAALRPYKLRDMEPYLDHKQIEVATGYSFDQVMGYEAAQGF